jgi:hypothetical protein
MAGSTEVSLFDLVTRFLSEIEINQDCWELELSSDGDFYNGYYYYTDGDWAVSSPKNLKVFKNGEATPKIFSKIHVPNFDDVQMELFSEHKTTIELKAEAIQIHGLDGKALSDPADWPSFFENAPLTAP